VFGFGCIKEIREEGKKRLQDQGIREEGEEIDLGFCFNGVSDLREDSRIRRVMGGGFGS
jgi:hypothetical protein